MRESSVIADLAVFSRSPSALDWTTRSRVPYRVARPVCWM